MQFWPPDDEHMCSKDVEAWNKLIVKQNFCASSWLITEINDIGSLYENLESPNLIKFGQKLWALYMETYVHFIVAGNVKLP